MQQNNQGQPRRNGGHNVGPSGRPRSSAARPAPKQDATRVATRAPAGGGQKPPAKKGGGGGKKKNTTRRIVLMNILKTLVVLGCIMVAAVSIIAVNVVRYVVESTAGDEEMLDLVALKNPQTGYIWATDPETGQQVVYQKLVGVSNSIWVPLEEMPQTLKDAIVSTEDREFYDHGGFRLGRTLYAGLNEVFHFRSTFGGSTIDQQLVKNLTGEKEVVGEDGEKTAGYLRKIREIFRAVALNKKYSKDMILEAYLNTLPLSGNIVGVQAGAKEYFNKDVSELTLTESAMIAGITNLPGKYNPYTNPEACLERRNNVLYFMVENGKLTQAEYDAAKVLPLGLYDGPREADIAPKQVNSYFADAVFNAVVTDLQEQEGISYSAAVFKYYNGGLNIYATVDLDLQREMEAVYTLGYGEGGLFPAGVTAEVETENGVETVHPQSAMAVLDYGGALKGVVGGIGEKTEDLVLNRAIQSPRPIGSTMKAISPYPLGIEYGLVDFSSLLLDAPVASRDPANPQRNPETGEVVFDWPYNYGENSANNVPMLLADAVAKSTNTVAARVGQEVGVDDMYEFLTSSLQISTLVPEGASNDKSLAPLVLGSLTRGISAYELAAAYAMYGNGGVYNKPYCYTSVTDPNGSLVLEPEHFSIQAVSEETAYIMNRLLRNVLHSSGGTGGTANGMAPAYLDAVAKTGTTTDDKDRWFVGLTPYYVSAVWWGYDENQEIQFSAAARTNPPPLVWKTVMEAVQEGKPERGFPEMPAGVTAETFCRDSGQIAGPNCTNRQTGYYLRALVPDECTIHSEPAA